MRIDPLRMFELRKCDDCGKEFIPASQHLYKLNKEGRTRWYCSYTCWKRNGGDNKHRGKKL